MDITKSRMITLGVAFTLLALVLVAPLVLFSVVPKNDDGTITPLSEVSQTPHPGSSNSSEVSLVSGVVSDKYEESGKYYVVIETSENELKTVEVRSGLYDVASQGVQLDIVDNLSDE